MDWLPNTSSYYIFLPTTITKSYAFSILITMIDTISLFPQND